MKALEFLFIILYYFLLIVLVSCLAHYLNLDLLGNLVCLFLAIHCGIKLWKRI